MGAERYEVVIVNANTGRQTKREWKASELLMGVPWLKRMNAQGGDINLRPLDGPELLLVDALDAQAVKTMRRQGLAPAVTIETSPGRFQAWVKLCDHPLPEDLRKQVVSGFARALLNGGHHGRLAGFTNQQADLNRAGQRPFVLAHEAVGHVAPSAQPYLTAVEKAEVAANQQQKVSAEKAKRAGRRDRGP
jgi:hypothetical protein